MYLSPTVQLKATSNSFEMRRDSEGRYFLGFARRSNSIGPMTIVIFAIGVALFDLIEHDPE